jgi:hypothetical protein
VLKSINRGGPSSESSSRSLDLSFLLVTQYLPHALGVLTPLLARALHMHTSLKLRLVSQHNHRRACPNGSEKRRTEWLPGERGSGEAYRCSEDRYLCDYRFCEVHESVQR